MYSFIIVIHNTVKKLSRLPVLVYIQAMIRPMCYLKQQSTYWPGIEISFPLHKCIKILKKWQKIYIKIKNILKKNFNKEGRQFTTFYVVYNANFSLRFHCLRIDHLCEGYPVFQGIWICLNMWKHSTFSHSKYFSFIISNVLLVFPLWRLFNTLWSCIIMYFCLLYNQWIYLLIGVQWGCVTYRFNNLPSLLPPHLFTLVIYTT